LISALFLHVDGEQTEELQSWKTYWKEWKTNISSS